MKPMAEWLFWFVFTVVLGVLAVRGLLKYLQATT